MVEKTDKYLRSKEKHYTSKLGAFLDNTVNSLDAKNKALINKEIINEKIALSYTDKVIKLTQDYYNLVEPYFDIARHTTVPFNYFYFLYLKMRNKFDNNILFKDGVHFFVALQGGGKSSIAFNLISHILKTTGKSSYVNANFELPQYDPVTKKHFKYFEFFKLMDFFDMSVRDGDEKIEVSQLKKFNRHFDTIVLDEWLTEMNHRLNKTKDYNNIFMALLTMIAHMRHQKMKRIYVLSQIDNTDIQLLSMFKYIHEVEVVLDISYMEWVANGELKAHIKGWHVWTYGVSRNRKKQSTDKVLIKKQFLKNTADFEYFDTLAQAEKYESLAEDDIKFL